MVDAGTGNTPDAHFLRMREAEPPPSRPSVRQIGLALTGGMEPWIVGAMTAVTAVLGVALAIALSCLLATRLVVR